MITLRKAATACTDAACAAAGRRNVVRAARFVLYRARLDIPGYLSCNGALALQQWILAELPAHASIQVIDVGAGVGRWSAAMLAAARSAGRLDAVDLHAFEPSVGTFALLAKALNGSQARLHNAALSDRVGWARMRLPAPAAGRSPPQPQALPEADGTAEVVTTTTLDAYAEQAGLDRLTLVRIDAGGHDLAVLRGARGLISGHCIWAVQFSYCHRWIDARCYLRDAFELLQPHGYRLGKLVPGGIEFYPAWDAELETFAEGNYVACLPGLADRLPVIRWWKQPG